VRSYCTQHAWIILLKNRMIKNKKKKKRSNRRNDY
jgi:hypothetical protein